MIERMLAKDPAERFATPAEFAEALEPFAAGSDLASLLTDSPRHLSPATRRPPPATPHFRRLALAAAGAAAILAFAFVVIEIYKDGRKTTVRAPEGSDITIRPSGDVEVKLPTPDKGIAAPPATARDYADRGSVYADRRDFVGAIIAYTEAIRLEPTVAEYYLLRGEAHWAMRRAPDPAIADLSEAIRLNPASTDAWVTRGTVYYCYGKTAEAAADFRQALRINPDCVQQYFQKAKTYRATGQPWRALNEYDKAVSIYCPLAETDTGALDQGRPRLSPIGPI